jgi:hypothetical protein
VLLDLHISATSTIIPLYSLFTMSPVNRTISPTRPHTGEATLEGDSKSCDQYELQETEYVEQSNANLTFDEDEAEPELHARTWLALAAMHLVVFTQVVALQGPPAVVRNGVSPLNSRLRLTDIFYHYS